MNNDRTIIVCMNCETQVNEDNIIYDDWQETCPNCWVLGTLADVPQDLDANAST
jgi:hypothetical protein